MINDEFFWKTYSIGEEFETDASYKIKLVWVESFSKIKINNFSSLTILNSLALYGFQNV